MSYTINIVDDSSGTTVKSYAISDAMILALKDRVPGAAGILSWIIRCFTGQIAYCVKQMRAKWQPVLIQEGTIVPSDDSAFVTLITARTDYKDRQTRDAEATASEPQ